MSNLTIKATLSNCILHRRGKLTVEGCKLQCYAGGLEHLFTPLVTLATAGLRVQREHLTRPMVTGTDAGMGVLSVVETRIRVSLLLCASEWMFCVDKVHVKTYTLVPRHDCCVAMTVLSSVFGRMVSKSIAPVEACSLCGLLQNTCASTCTPSS